MIGSDSSVPKFSMNYPRYDQSTIWGRSLHFYSITDPRTLFIGKEQLSHAQQLITQWKEGSLPAGVDDKQLWDARREIESCLHPDTGESIPPLFRFSAFPPVNIFIVTAMLMPGVIGSVPKTIMIHWFNQSYNAAINFANRNASSEVSNARLAGAYVGAVASSVSIALGATYITKKVANASPTVRTLVRATLPFSAVVVAGCTNLALIRASELTEGVEMEDEEGNSHGLSVTAGRTGILKCSIARFLWNVPTMIMCPFIVQGFSKMAFWSGLSPRMKMVVETATITFMLFVGVPPALAAYPQRDSIPVSKLEEKFQNLKDSQGRPIERLYYNKGL